MGHSPLSQFDSESIHSSLILRQMFSSIVDNMNTHKCFNPECTTVTSNPKFCSRSCSATITNTTSPKRSKEYKYRCSACGEPVSNKKTVVCQSCRNLAYQKSTIDMLVYEKGHRSNAFGAIRSRARTVAKQENRTKCEVCGYTKHIEVCHKKPISAFSGSATMAEVNANKNLIVLCPNHHWELDAGEITI